MSSPDSVGAGLLAMNDYAVCLVNRGAWIASKPAPTVQIYQPQAAITASGTPDVFV
ncbi:hypothetical protein [Pseudomonas migulae]|uniref:hypothetical protein n=1 Tax=Pseudomonas migulae TaxID=78543 RepID=UPI0013566C41|nr:hypothetical protein [Pseudomonas migulae]